LRPIFIGAGALLTDPQYFPGDAWQDAQGMFRAAVAASPVWELLGAKIYAAPYQNLGQVVRRGSVDRLRHISVNFVGIAL
jgi:hypothetical protein